MVTFFTVTPGWGQVTVPSGQSGQQFLFGGTGWLWLSGFSNPALLSALYSTPLFPLTGYYPLFPGTLVRLIPGDLPRIGPVRVHPSLGLAEMYTDNVFRLNTKRQSDFFHTVAPGIQVQLPFVQRHLLVMDYRTNLQFYERTPSNNVQDQTAAVGLKLNFPFGLRLDLQGEYKLGHDPRGTAVDTQSVEVNKWATKSFTGQAQIIGSKTSIVLTTQAIQWTYLNNNQDLIRNRLATVGSLTVLRRILPKTSALLNVGAVHTTYEQNTNLDATTYTASGGLKWDATEKTSGEIQVGYQYLRFDDAQRDPSTPLLARFQRDRDSYSNLFVSGRISWKPTSYSTVLLQPYRAIIQDVVGSAVFFTATGVNLSASHSVTDRIQLTANLGIEHDQATSVANSGGTGATSRRTDVLTSAGGGVNYRTTKWFGLGLQYVFEHRSSTSSTFEYQANTVMLSVQAAL
ncbi:outer membrane beta-barrel protein [Candidatus Nitrospira bockiana]